VASVEGRSACEWAAGILRVQRAQDDDEEDLSLTLSLDKERE
jgi:hypothetical protein